MFTGIVEEVGRVVSMSLTSADVESAESIEVESNLARLRIDAPRISANIGLGDSVAVNGVCLTVTSAEEHQVCFDAVRETLERSALGDLVAGSHVNLERALQANGRLDGHIVQGHVDGVGTIVSLEQQGADVRLLVRCAPELAGLLVDKGSVTIDGVSLTVVTAREDRFDVVLIPHTLSETTLGDYEPGRRVNLEADILGKYVKAYLDRTLAHPSAAGDAAR